MRPRCFRAGLRRRASLLAFLLAACAEGPREIHAGADECAHCRMLVSDDGFAAQLLTDRGRSYVFDSIECMAEFLDRGEVVPEERVRSLWVTDFARPGLWIPAQEARFLRSEGIRSPMGMNLSAHADEDSARALLESHGGDLLDWAGVRALVAAEPVRGGGHAH